MKFNRIRISTRSTQMLGLLKNKTGLTPNILARFAKTSQVQVQTPKKQVHTPKIQVQTSKREREREREIPYWPCVGPCVGPNIFLVSPNWLPMASALRRGSSTQCTWLRPSTELMGPIHKTNNIQSTVWLIGSL